MIHPVIDACLEIVKSGVLDAENIERIELTVNPLAVKLCDIMNPGGRNQGLVSMQHWAVMTLTHGAAGIAQVTDALVRDAVVSGLRRKVVHTATESMPWIAANVRVLLKDGKQLQGGVQHCRGSSGRPLTDDDLTAKARGQLRTAYPDAKAERILAQSWRIEECPRVDAFCKQLTTNV